MKVSNEFKVGVLAAIAITLLILGFNFLKGKNVFEKKASMFVTFSKTEGLNISDPIKINGLRVGAVEAMQEKDANMSGIVVEFHLTRVINIPKDSYAKISASPLGTAFIIITMGESKEYLKNGDTLQGVDTKGLMESFNETINPTIENVNKTIRSLDTAIKKISNIFDQKASDNIGNVLKSLSETTARLNNMLEPGKGNLFATVDNVKKFTGNLSNNNDSITVLVNNLTKVSRDLSSSHIDKSVGELKNVAENLNNILVGMKEGKGSMGMLLNDKQLYKNLNSTTNSLNVLLQDLKLHPKRYVQISVFGKKEKTQPLESAIPDSLNK